MKEEKTKTKNTKTLVLLDAHAILHRAYHALPDFSSQKGEPTGALYGLTSMIIRIVSDLKPDFVAACLDLPGPTYRHEAYEGYKAKRPKADSDLVSQIERSRAVFEALNIPIYDKAGFEADDILGTIVETLKRDKDLKIIIASGDMDTLQLVDDRKVTVFTLRKGLSDTVLYDEKAVVTRFGFSPEQLPDYKGLRGDPSDNIVGVKGIGEKTATTLIQKFGTIEEIYKQIKSKPEKLKEVGITDRIIEILKTNEEEAVFSKMLATIRRDAPIKFELPEKSWKESFKFDKADTLFQELDFRTLGGRLRSVVNGEPKQGTLLGINKSDSTKVKEKNTEKTQSTNPNVSAIDLEEAAVALWVLNTDITNPTYEEILRYAKTEDFQEAKKKILEEIKSKNLSFVFEEIERPLIPILKKVKEHGIKVDRAFLSKLSRDYHKELAEREKSIWELAGEEFNINSPKQLGVVLFDKMNISVKNQKKTSTGQKSTKESELEKMRELHPIIPLILEYRHFQKLLSTYIDNIPEMLDENERLHTTLLQTGASTGRMASKDPNLQNIPIKSELGRNIRKAFVSERGFSLLALDYSQIELRVAAMLSKDAKLLSIFKNNEDVHTSVASFVFKVPPEKVDKEMRRKAKVINFGILYGMGVTALRQNLGTDREEAQRFYNDYFTTFKELAEYLDQVKVQAARNGYTETFFGRRRYLQAINSKIPYIRAAAEREAINAPIQGTEADIIKLAMKEIYAFIQKEKLEESVHMLLQVHDELLFEVKDDVVDEVAPKIKKIMEGVLPKEKAEGVLFEVNGAVGKNWGEMSDLKL